LRVPTIGRNLNEAGLADFFSFGYLLGDKTFVQGVKLMPPASRFVYHGGVRSMHHYWNLEFPDSYLHRPDEWYDSLIHDSIADAIDQIVDSGRRYTIALSGGLDTRWIAALLSRRQPETVAMTFGQVGCDDVQFAARVAQQTGIRHVWIPLTEDAVTEQTEMAVHVTDGMFNVIHANEIVLSLAQPTYGDVSVGGFLGGELFGSGVDPRTIFLPKRGILPYLYRKLRQSSLSDRELRRVFGDERYLRLKQLALQSLRDCVEDANSDIPVNMLDHFYLRQRQRRFTFMGQLLKQPYIDARYPFCHHRVVEAALQLPPAQRLVERAYRRSLARHFPSLDGIPWERTLLAVSTPLLTILPHYALRKTLERLPIGWLPSQLGGLHVQRRYFADYATWMQGNLGRYVKSVLLGPDSNPLQIFNSAYVGELVEAQVAGRRDLKNFIGLLLTFELWSRMFVGLVPVPSIADTTIVDGATAGCK
jgi:asparagine synthase (glutamine-hydrolysing)